MPISKGSKKVRISVLADQGTETFIIDDRRELKIRGVGNFTTDQSPGEYKVKFRTGTAIRVGQWVIEHGSPPVTIEAHELMFSSPAVLEGTTKTHEYHMRAAEKESRTVHKRMGTGSQLFVFTRAWTDGTSAGFLNGKDPATGLTLHDLHGNLLVDFEREGVHHRVGVFNNDGEPIPPYPFDPWAACNINVDPGTYRLRLQTPNWGAIEQVVVASPKWQTQIFLLQKEYSGQDQPGFFGADLVNAAIILSPIGQGFDSADRKLRLCEIARIALEDRRHTMAEALLKGSLADNPMLGIYAAHALLRTNKPNRRLIATSISKLRKLLGAHPDVEALALYLKNRIGGEHASLETPPMLRSSWSIIVGASIKKSVLIPYLSLSARISTHIWGDSTWLIWLTDQLEDLQSLNISGSIEESLREILRIAIGLEIDNRCGYPKAWITGNLKLHTYEGALLAYLIQGQIEQNELAKSMGVPPAAIHAIAGRLLKNLNAFRN